MSIRASISALLLAAATALSLVACSSDEQIEVVQTPAAREKLAAGACNSRLVPIQTGPQASCQSGSIHFYPIDVKSSDCHGWRAVDPNGKLHDNSVNRITCNGDGTFSLYQYADSLTCTETIGPAVKKTFHPGLCEQDRPPTLYSIPADALACCVAPDSPACKKGFPTVTQPNPEIFLNGQECTE